MLRKRVIYFKFRKDKTGGAQESARLVGDGCLVACFFDDWQDLFEFAEVFQYGDASLGDGEDYAAFADGAFFD